MPNRNSCGTTRNFDERSLTARDLYLFGFAYASLKRPEAAIRLMEDSIRDAYGEGIATFDLLAPGDNYKLDWADASTGVSTFVAPLTLAGRAYARLYLGQVRPGLKKLMILLPISLRRRLAR